MDERVDGVVAGARRRPRGLVFGGLIVLGCAAAVLYGLAGAGNSGADACPAAAKRTARLDPLIHGEVAAFGLTRPARVAPELSFKGSSDRTLTLQDLKGKTLLVNFWATWCVPCRKEMPALDRLQGQLGGSDFEVVAINVDTSRLDRPKTFLRDTGIAHLGSYSDPSADVLQQLKVNGGFIGLPTTLLIDRDGCELGRIAGPADWSSPDATALVAAAEGD